MNCKYCGAKLKKDSVGLYCPTKNCQWSYQGQGYKPAEDSKNVETTSKPEDKSYFGTALAPSKDLGTWEETDWEDRIREFQKDFDSCVEPEERGDVMFNLVSDIRDEIAAEIEKAREEGRNEKHVLTATEVMMIENAEEHKREALKEIRRESVEAYKKTLSEEIEKMKRYRTPFDATIMSWKEIRIEQINTTGKSEIDFEAGYNQALLDLEKRLALIHNNQEG